MIEIKRSENCILEIPKKGTEKSAGFDISSNQERFDLFPGEKILVSSGFSWKIPDGYVGIIKPRSGLAHKNGIDILAGVIDSDYRGEVKVIMQNHGKKVLSVGYGDRIAQMIIVPIHHVSELVLVDEFDETARGQNGFGSTGR